MKHKKSDCDLILNDVENVFGSIGDCFKSTFDEKKSKMQVIGGIFGIGKSVLKLGWNGGACAVKHPPQAVVTVAKYKRELIVTVTEEYQNYQKEQKEDALDAKMAKLKMKKKVY